MDRNVQLNKNCASEPTDRKRFRISGSGVDLEGNIISRIVSFGFVDTYGFVAFVLKNWSKI